MSKLQFRVLYREFLFRMIDFDILAVQGDMKKLLGQFAAFLVFLSIFLALLALSAESHLPRREALINAWPREHSLIAVTMLVVGIFAVLSWDSTFLNRRDVLVLTPLPIHVRTLFLAKVAASGMALSITVAALNALPGFILPVVLAPPDNGGLLSLILSLVPVRCFAAYWITMFSSGAFIFCSVLAVQGVAAQLLSRRRFLKISAFLQMAAFCLFLSVYFLEPSLSTPKALTSPENQTLLAWLPSYWFLGFFQLLNGSMHPALAPLARRALVGFGTAVFATATAFLLSYFLSLRKIAEEPDISSGGRRAAWLPRFGNLLETAVVQFSIRTLFRSRQHRLILSFYWGIGFAVVIFMTKTQFAQQRYLAASGYSLGSPVNVPMLVSSIVMMCAAVLGTRVVFSLPLEVRANWIFRIAPLRGGPDFLAATRRSLFVLALAPVWITSAIFFLSMWPWPEAARHLLVLGLLGTILVELSLHRFPKIAFTCSYLPGKSQANMVILAVVVCNFLIIGAAEYERRALRSPSAYAALVLSLCFVTILARWRTAVLVKCSESALQFEEEETPALQGLGLQRDGVWPIQCQDQL